MMQDSFWALSALMSHKRHSMHGNLISTSTMILHCYDEWLNGRSSHI